MIEKLPSSAEQPKKTETDYILELQAMPDEKLFQEFEEANELLWGLRKEMKTAKQEGLEAVERLQQEIDTFRDGTFAIVRAEAEKRLKKQLAEIRYKDGRAFGMSEAARRVMDLGGFVDLREQEAAQYRRHIEDLRRR